MTVPGTVEVRQGLLQPPGAVPGHGAECDQAVTPGDENTRTRRYGAGVAATCDMKYKVFIFHSNMSQKSAMNIYENYEKRWRTKPKGACIGKNKVLALFVFEEL